MNIPSLLFFISFWINISLGQKLSDTLIIDSHFNNITQTQSFRNYRNLRTLDSVAKYIFDEFDQYCDTVFYQVYELNGIEYKNVIARSNIKSKEKLVIGAHYDVCGDQEGADDNASGVVGLLELARLMEKDTSIHHQIEFVAYTLEEPPFFKTDYMGSAIHAKSLVDSNEQIDGMICLEMIGYFDEAKKTQDYPIGILKLFYGGKGDYITVVQKFSPGKFARKLGKRMKKKKRIKTKIFKGPKALQGIDFSDHLNYWKYDISSVMITDTAFYRNKNYHERGDVLSTIDIPKMALVIDQVYLVVKEWK